jgi:hypothetical protein
MRLVARTAERDGIASVRLEGGTALSAYYLGHRESEDLDFFSDLSVDQQRFGAAVGELLTAEGLRFELAGSSSPHFARFIVNDGEGGLKLDFAAQSPFRLQPLEETSEGIRIASYRDLAASKLHAVCDRFEVRDYIDLHAILTSGMDDVGEIESVVRERTRRLVRDVIEIDPGLNPRIVGDAVAKAIGRPLVARFPLRLLKPVTDQELQPVLVLFAAECAALVGESLRDSF